MAVLTSPASSINESRSHIRGLPGKIVRVDWNAVAAKARAWIERHVAKGLGRSGVDHFPNVDVHAQAELLELIDERNVHATENVLK